MSSTKIEVKKDFNASAEEVYDAWLNPEAIKNFMKPGDDVTVPEPKIEAEVRGRFQFDMHVGEDVLPHIGEYKVLERAEKIQFTWNSKY